MERNIRKIMVMLAVLLLSACPAVTAGAVDGPAVEWQKVLGGAGSDTGISLDLAGDGGYILIGCTTSTVSGDVGVNHGGSDAWVVKLTPAGSIDWQKVLGGSSNDYGQKVWQTGDGGYIAAAITLSNTSGDVGVNHGSADAWVVKLTPSGSIDWQKVLGGSGDDAVQQVQQTRDGGYIAAGTTMSSASGNVGLNHGKSDAWVVKLTPAGSIDWQKVLGGSGDDAATDIRETGDGSYILAGYTGSNTSGDIGVNHGGRDVWAAQLTGTGTIVWLNVLGGSGNEAATSVQQTGDGGYILAGYTDSGASGDVGVNHGHSDAWVVKLTPAGTIGWQKVLGGNGFDFGMTVRQAGDGGYILAGHTTSNTSGDVGVSHGSMDAWVLKLTPAGTVGWQKVLGGSDIDSAFSVRETGDGGYIVAGSTASDSSGDVGANHGGYDAWVVKLLGKPVIPLPGYTIPPTDPDGDGICEDLNANGRMDFADVVLYFNQMTWIAESEPIEAFDLNGNGRIDFADIVALFNKI